MGTFLVASILVIMIGGILMKLIKDKKAGKCSCGSSCGCGGRCGCGSGCGGACGGCGH